MSDNVVPIKSLRDLEDTFIDHLLDLKDSEGFRLYREWLQGQIDRVRTDLEKILPEAQTNHMRGQIHAGKVALMGVDLLINQRQEQIKEEQQNEPSN
jgi:hypothetical protein